MMKITSLQNILKLQLSKWQRQCFGSAGIDANTPHILHKILFVSMFRRFLFLYVPQLHCSMKQTSDMPHPCIPACIPSRRVPDSTRMFRLTTLHNAYYECVWFPSVCCSTAMTSPPGGFEHTHTHSAFTRFLSLSLSLSHTHTHNTQHTQSRKPSCTTHFGLFEACISGHRIRCVWLESQFCFSRTRIEKYCHRTISAC